MAFLSPWYLLALLAVAIPLAIHLIRRDKPESIPFSTLRFIARPRRLNALLQRLQQWLLLALRITIFALLALAFARPFLTGDLAALSGVEPSATVILVDRSMSMAYGDQDERARDAAREIVGRLKPGEEVALVAFSGSTEAVFELDDDLAGARGFIDSLPSPGFGETRYLPALRLAARMLEEAPHPRREVVLISDFQEAGMNHFDRDWMLPPGVLFSSVRVGEESVLNLAVTDVRSPETLTREEEQIELLARVRNLGTVPVERAEVVLTIDGVEMERRAVDLTGRSEVVVRFAPTLARGDHASEVSVGNDDYPLDNRFHFAIRVLPRIDVLAVNGEPSATPLDDEGHWFRLAAAGSEASRFDVEMVNAGAALDMSGREAVVLLNVEELPGAGGALTRYLGEGGSVLVALGDRVDAAGYNRWLASADAVTLAPAYITLEEEYLVLADVLGRHPIFREIGSAGSWGMRVRAYWPLVPGEKDTVLMRFDNGAPALVESGAFGGRLLLFASTLDTEWNDLPLQSMYLPFLYESLEYLAARPAARRFYRVGDSAPVAAGGRGELAVIDPDGARASLRAGSEGTLYTPPFMQPGFHRVTGLEEPMLLAVNTRVEESDFTRVALNSLEDLVVNPSAPTTPPARILAARVARDAERNQRIWWWLLLAVLVMGCAESLVANRTYR